MNAILDTSVFVALESGRPLEALPDRGGVSVMTVAELRLGVLAADDHAIRAQRMRTLTEVERLRALPVDDAVARHFAELVAEAGEQGARPKVVDALIAATARSCGLPVYTQDADFDSMPGVEVVRV